MQVISTEDLAVGLGLLADKLKKPLSNHVLDSSEIPENSPRHATQESLSVATVAMETPATQLAVQSQFVMPPEATNQMAEAELRASDWLASAFQTQPAALNPAAETGNSAGISDKFPPTNAGEASLPPAKKIILLVTKRPMGVQSHHAVPAVFHHLQP